MSDLAGTGLVCGHRGKVVLDAGDVTIRAGELTIVLGPNGAGKSTLLLTLAGLLPPVAGSVSVCGLTARDRARQVAFLPQEESSAFPLTVRETVAIGRTSHARGLRDSAEDLKAIDAAIERVGLTQESHTMIERLSGGQRRRVLVARALAQEAPAMVLDEPIAHLDVAYALEILELLKLLSREGRAVLASLHDVPLALEYADRILLVSRGRIRFHGHPSTISAADDLAPAYGVVFERRESLAARPM